MFGKKKQPPIRSLIAQGSCIEGNLKFSDGLRVDGEVIGDIRANEGSPSILVISESAKSPTRRLKCTRVPSSLDSCARWPISKSRKSPP